ncbi:MAG: YggS family pyridoxal phosphate-dependent enzyme [Spirochaetaceae bacterium]|jgi:pyridoxal phosphate enzyme (YggS family)|nr:YggS family pyridoxal phosphate-dependent enzyme [Spirochaetaceae bacterium]
MAIPEALAQIHAEIAETCIACGRAPADVKLMAVSKFHAKEAVAEAYNAGQRLFGESRVQECEAKFSRRSDDFPGAAVHLIGALQRNKVKAAVRLFDCIQSVDRNELVAELAKQTAGREQPLEIFLELKTGEDTKSGYRDVEALFGAVEAVLACPGLRLTGLMTMAPFVGEDIPIRRSFAALRQAAEKITARYSEVKITTLSMGMSGDFKIAIEEGANLIRIGTAIFGERSA